MPIFKRGFLKDRIRPGLQRRVVVMKVGSKDFVGVETNLSGPSEHTSVIK